MTLKQQQQQKKIKMVSYDKRGIKNAIFFFIERHELMEKWYFLATQQVNTHDYCYLFFCTHYDFKTTTTTKENKNGVIRQERN